MYYNKNKGGECVSLNRYNRFIDSLNGLKSHYVYNDKDKNINDYIMYFLNRFQSIFKYEGLPDSIPQRNIELMLQCNGHCCISEVDGVLYAFTGGLGGEPNVYYMPTIYTVSNPYLNFSKNLKINEDCIVIHNDTMYMGLLPLLQRYCNLLVENDISINIATINSRIISILTALSDNAKDSAEEYIEGIKNGELGVIGDTGIFGESDIDLLTTNQGKTGILTDLIELQQYTKASLYNDMGLNANYNMKRESLNSAESQLNNDMLLPYIDDMLRCRQNCFEEVNKKYGTNIKVSLFSAWEDNEIEIEKAQETIEQGGENVDEKTENDVERSI